MIASLFTTLLFSLACTEEESKVEDTSVSTVEPSSEDTDTSDTEDTDTAVADTADTDSIDTALDTGTVDVDTGEPIDTGTTTDPGPNAVANFSLPDINPASPTLGQNISPRDYLQQISGWYFIKAT